MEDKKYIPQPIDTSDVNLPKELEQLAELLSKNVHEVWAETRITQGWKYGEQRNDEFKTHPCLVPYEELPEEEKEYEEIQYVSMEDFESVKHDAIKHVSSEQEEQEEV